MIVNDPQRCDLVDNYLRQRPACIPDTFDAERSCVARLEILLGRELPEVREWLRELREGGPVARRD